LIVELSLTGAQHITSATICNKSLKLIDALASEGASASTRHHLHWLLMKHDLLNIFTNPVI
jgi:hypothetical protein